MDLEVWKKIDGYTGIYSISNKRRIKRNRCDIIDTRGRILHLKERIFNYKKTGHVSLRLGLKKSINVNINDLFYKYFPEEMPILCESTSEIWKDIKDYEGIYQVSDKGNVRRIKTLRSKCEIETYMLKPHLCKSNGYLMVTLSKNCKIIHKYIHRLVAQTFLPNPNNYPCINHKDETRTNNNIENLEWCTYKYNANYGTSQQRHSLQSKNKGRSAVVEQRNKNGDLIKVFPSLAEVTRLLGFDSAHISHCIKTNKLAYGYKWIRKS